ncbi:MAG: bifunctional adenosylcobinamide kinase/adenosylcobinamide-phosphate guanylyltransferase [Nocardioides sp.]
MTVRLLGTGAADGWPNPFCACPSCGAERRDGRTRGQTAVLIDDTLLLDCGPETPQAAARRGLSLDAVRAVLITHQHSDHFGPAFLMHRSWVTSQPLVVLAPPDVIEACRPWLTSNSTVDFRAVQPGDSELIEGDSGSYEVRVLPARHRTGLGVPGHAESVLFDIATPQDGRVLYATDTGPLARSVVDAMTDARYDIVLLEETFGDHHAHGTDHLDLSTFGEQVRRLREVAAITETTELIAIHLSHHNPPTRELNRRLADWGARVVDDGTVLGAEPGQPGHAPRRTLVIGGARSGKSREAERMVATEPALTYVATGYLAGADQEWAARVGGHRARRPAHWRTVETIDLAALLAIAGEPLLIDCLTLWLTRVMDAHQAWTAERSDWQAAEQAVIAEIDQLAAAWRHTARRVVAVTNETGQGVVPETAAGRRFRDLMGTLNAAVAAESDDVRWCVAGRVHSL